MTQDSHKGFAETAHPEAPQRLFRSAQRKWAYNRGIFTLLTAFATEVGVTTEAKEIRFCFNCYVSRALEGHMPYTFE